MTIASGYMGSVISLDVAAHTDELLTTPQEIKNRKFKRGLEWDWSKPTGFSRAIESSIHAPPLSRPPPISEDPDAAYGIKRRPDLFAIKTPINVKLFNYMLRDHPNRPFVDLVIQGLTEGFRPMCELPDSDSPHVENHSICEERPELLTAACEEEVSRGQYSPPFQTLLAGMKVSPLLLAAKSNLPKMRVCTDMSYRKHSLNNLVRKDECRVAFDSIISFAPYIVEKFAPDRELVIWKSDVQNAYRILPMCLQWQLRQIVGIDGRYYVDRCANFGSSASPKIWCSVFSLVLWIAEKSLGIEWKNNLMDNTSGVAYAHTMVKYTSHRIPKDQALFLLLFDTLAIPWEWKNQVHGFDLQVIGFHLRPNKLIFTLTPEKKKALIDRIEEFVRKPASPLRDWQQLLGWCSWALNIFPLGRFALQSAWDKTGGKTKRNMNVPINKIIQSDLRWLAQALKQSDGIQFLDASLWSTNQADIIFTADACPTGYGVWLPNSAEGFHGSLATPSRDIYWAKLYAVAHAIELGIARKLKKILICTDSRNVCNLFLAHRPVEIVRDLFASIIKLIVIENVDVRVAHLPGAKNVFADALSRGNLSKVRSLPINALIVPFKPESSFPDGGKKKF